MFSIHKKLYPFILLLLVLGVSCRKEFGNVAVVNYNIKALFPEGYSKQFANGVDITLVNTYNNLRFTATTNGDGIAVFDTLLPGNYLITGLREVGPGEAQELTGEDAQLFLSGSLQNIRILGNGSADLQLRGGRVGVLIFKELSYTGSRTPAGGSYFSDQFYEIYNNSLTETIYADSLCIGNVGGSPGNSSTQKPYGFQTDPDNTYLVNIWMIPTDLVTPGKRGKTYPILPGQSIIIAQDGINHRTDPLGNANSVNLGKGIADFESYIPRADNKDLDAPDVTNLDPVYLGSVGFDWLTSVFGAGMVIFKHPDPASLPLQKEPGSTSNTQYVQVPNQYILDAVDLVANPTAAGFKRIPGELDAGFTYCSGTYTNEARRRKVFLELNGQKILQDTNNSSEDFELITPPTPKSW